MPTCYEFMQFHTVSHLKKKIVSSASHPANQHTTFLDASDTHLYSSMTSMSIQPTTFSWKDTSLSTVPTLPTSQSEYLNQA